MTHDPCVTGITKDHPDSAAELKFIRIKTTNSDTKRYSRKAHLDDEHRTMVLIQVRFPS